MFVTARNTTKVRANRGERGQVLLLFVALFSILLVAAAIGIDQGLFVGRRRVAQKDADTAARGGAAAFLSNTTDYNGAQALARSIATKNGAPVNANTTFTASANCVGQTFSANDVPSVAVQINEPTGALFSRTFGLAGISTLGANATACVGRPSEYQGSDPYFTAPGSVSDPCFNSNGQPAIGVTCTFKTDSQNQQSGGRGNLSLAASAGACTQQTKKDLQEQIETGSDAICRVGDVVNIAQGNNTSDNLKGLQCRLVANASGCEDNLGEGSCDSQFHDNNGSIPPFSNPTSASGIDDFTEVFSRPGGGKPQNNWASTDEVLVPNICNGRPSLRIMTIIIGEPCPTGCDKTVTVAGFATFYLEGCAKLDKDGNVDGALDIQCNGNGNSGVVGIFVRAFIPEGGGVPQPPVAGASLSIFLVK